MKLVQCIAYSVSTVGTGLVLQHQSISSHRAKYAPIQFPIFYGLRTIQGLISLNIHIFKIL